MKCAPNTRRHLAKKNPKQTQTQKLTKNKPCKKDWKYWKWFWKGTQSIAILSPRGRLETFISPYVENRKRRWTKLKHSNFRASKRKQYTISWLSTKTCLWKIHFFISMCLTIFEIWLKKGISYICAHRDNPDYLNIHSIQRNEHWKNVFFYLVVLTIGDLPMNGNCL